MRITIDPITRIEGHLRIDVDVDALQALEAAADTLLWGAEANPARWGRRALMMKELVTEP